MLTKIFKLWLKLCIVYIIYLLDNILSNCCCLWKYLWCAPSWCYLGCKLRSETGMLCHCTICFPLQPELLLAYSDRCDTLKPACSVISLFNSRRRLACAGAHNTHHNTTFGGCSTRGWEKNFCAKYGSVVYFGMAEFYSSWSSGKRLLPVIGIFLLQFTLLYILLKQ